MKAWVVGPKEEFYRTVVFAENRGKAKVAAMATDACDDTDFIDIEVRRLPTADSQYKGRSEMHWEDPADRLFLVKECGFYCEYVEPGECARCSAKEFCEEYQQSLEELESENE